VQQFNVAPAILNCGTLGSGSTIYLRESGRTSSHENLQGRVRGIVDRFRRRI
jgi:hypothetical protein